MIGLRGFWLVLGKCRAECLKHALRTSRTVAAVKRVAVDPIAVGGGLLRDIIIQEVPYVLKKHIYAVASIIGGVAFWALCQCGFTSAWAAASGAAVTFVVRILATIFKWNLPKAIE